MSGCQNDKTEDSNTNVTSEENSYAPVANDVKKAADFNLKTLDGKDVKLSDYKGKIVIIDFWATWCPPCRKGIPDLVELQKEYKDNLVVIGISLDQQNTIKDLDPFIQNYGINYPVVLGTQKVVADYGNIQAIPTSFIVDQSGNIVDTHVGLVPKSTYTEKINKLLKRS
jgi:cytochrome c biogenesis protein CcmG/thiol:disulfide interchange protein DsbE